MEMLFCPHYSHTFLILAEIKNYSSPALEMFLAPKIQTCHHFKSAIFEQDIRYTYPLIKDPHKTTHFWISSDQQLISHFISHRPTNNQIVLQL